MDIVDNLNWIENWFAKQCDGDWEHEFGIRIETLDNPGWSIEIDLVGTELEDKELSWKLIEESDSNWYGFKFSNSKFEASGDIGKLAFLIELFRSYA